MVWRIVEGVLGVGRERIIGAVKEGARRIVEGVVCKCEHTKWQHQEGVGKCACGCPKFEGVVLE